MKVKAIVFGLNSVNTLGLVRSLGLAKHDVYLILFDGLINFVSKSRFVKKSYIIKDYNEALPTVKEIANNIKEKPVLIVSGDKEGTYINENYEEFIKYCYVEGGYKNCDINKYRDKNKLDKLVKEVGLNTIETILIKDNHDITEKLEFPVIVKANNSISGGKEVVKVCKDKDVLKKHLSSVPKDNFPLLMQPYLTKDYELVLLGCSLNNGKNVLSPICFHKTRSCGYGDSFTAYGYSVYIDNNEAVKSLEEKIASIIMRIGYTGLFSAEFLCSGEKSYFLEINFRNDATAILSTISGYNLPDYLCKWFVLNHISKIDKNSFNKVHYMDFISDFSNVLNKKVGLFTWLKQAFINCHWYIFDRHDMLPGVYYFIFRIKRKLKNLLARQ